MPAVNIPPEDLVVRARELDPNYHAKVERPGFDEEHAPDWRNYIPRDVRRLWGRMDYGMRLVSFVIAAACAAERERRRSTRGEA